MLSDIIIQRKSCHIFKNFGPIAVFNEEEPNYMYKQPYVIAVSGDSGAGKTTLVHQLVSLFGNAVSLLLDDYTEDAIYPPTLDWLKNGANPDEFITPQFVANLKSLRDGRSIIHPESKAEILPAEYIILEEPFGRSRTVIKDLIDYHVLVQIPPEIALARKVMRNISKLEEDEHGEKLNEFLEWYLRVGRDFFAAVREQAAKDVDLVVNGELPSEVLAQKIFETTRARQKP